MGEVGGKKGGCFSPEAAAGGLEPSKHGGVGEPRQAGPAPGAAGNAEPRGLRAAWCAVGLLRCPV